MKKTFNKGSKLNKGAPSGVVVSLLFHLGAFFIAGLFVVFTVVNKPEPEFEAPPPVERPRMKLKKPKVKVRKSSQPKPSSRIVAKVKTREMPEIQLPDLQGTGEGLMGGTGFGEVMDLPDIGEMTVFGSGMTTGNDMEVTFYSFARRPNGDVLSNMTYQEYYAVLRKFVQRGWDKSLLSRYYRSPKKLYATTIFIPITSSTLGPAAFGESMDYGYCWVALYEGKLVHKDGITFRFWGAADDVLTVAVDNEVVLAANFYGTGAELAAFTIADDWVSHAVDNRVHRLNNQRRTGGDWITLEPGVPMDFKAIVGEGPGGEFAAGLLVEVQGENYPLNDQGSPILPVFAMDELPWALQDSIMLNLIDGEANVTNVTTIFKDY